MSTTKRIVIDKTLTCQRAGTTVRVTVTEVALQLGTVGLPATIAHAPKCYGWPPCGAFPLGFPQEMGEVSISAVTGCPFFDGRDDGGV